MAGPQFYCVVGNRDHLKVKSADGSSVKRPLWDFVDRDHDHWLTSLVYLKNMEIPAGRRFFDCGAWSYKHEPDPRWSAAECLERYAAVAADGDLVAAPDHMILRDHDEAEQERRRAITIGNAKAFIDACPPGLTPVGVVHGRDVAARVGMARCLLDFGYTYLAVGSIAGQAGDRKYVKEVLDAVCGLRESRTFRLHVLGISALSWYGEFRDRGVDSFDGSAMFFAAFTGGQYYWHEGGGRIAKFKVREVDPATIPACDCPPCAAMRGQGDDPRSYGSNENNMGRAIHNVNVYLDALHDVAGTPAIPDEQGRLFP